MGDEARHEWTAFGRASWGPVHVEVAGRRVEARVGDAVVVLDLEDRRPAAARQAEPFRSIYDFGVPVRVGGREVATITSATPQRGGVLRRERLAVTGDEAFVLPGFELTHRALPNLLTLRSRDGWLVTSRRWAEPVNMAVTEWSVVREYDLVPPRVGGGTRPDHLALWFAVKESLRR